MLQKMSKIHILQPMELIPTFREIFCINRILRLMHSSLNDKNGYGELGQCFFPRQKPILPLKKWKFVPVKKSEKPSKSARENRKLPVKIFLKMCP